MTYLHMFCSMSPTYSFTHVVAPGLAHFPCREVTTVFTNVGETCETQECETSCWCIGMSVLGGTCSTCRRTMRCIPGAQKRSLSSAAEFQAGYVLPCGYERLNFGLHAQGRNPKPRAHAPLPGVDSMFTRLPKYHPQLHTKYLQKTSGLNSCADDGIHTKCQQSPPSLPHVGTSTEEALTRQREVCHCSHGGPLSHLE